jgi:uncharacterized membrane protein YtjA (UPF0391 family)
MLSWIVAFLVVPIIPALFGFTGIAAEPSDIARVCGFFLVVVFGVSLVWRRTTSRLTAVRT